jgi:hypothetical protein
MKRVAVTSLCLFALAATPPLALGQSAGDEQYSDPFAGQEQAQSAPDSSQNDGSQGGQGNSVAGAPDSTPAAAGQTGTSGTEAGSGSGSGSGSKLAYTGFSAGILALLGALALVAGLMLRVLTGRPPIPRRDAVLVLGRDVRLQPRSRRR